MKGTSTFKFSYLKDFSRYLLEHKLDEATTEHIRLVREVKLPMLRYFSHLSEVELFEVGKQSIRDFFEQVIDDTVYDVTIVNIERWKENLLIEIPKEGVEVSDIVDGNSIRKQLVLKFIPDYTSDSKIFCGIMLELEKFYSLIEKESFTALSTIQQEEIYKKNEFLASLVNNTVHGIFAYDNEFKITEWNPSLERTLNIKKDNILGKEIIEIIPAYSGTEELKVMQDVIGKGKAFNLSGRAFKSTNGFFDAFLTPLRDKDDNIIGGLCILNDITERKAAEEVLQEQREELETYNEELHENLSQLLETQQALKERESLLLEAQAIAHLGIWEYRPDTLQLSWSDEMRRILEFGLDEEILDYTGYFEMIHPDDKSEFNRIMDGARKGDSYIIEHRIVTRNGNTKWLLANGKAVIDQTGKIIKFKGTILDITDRKEAELKVMADQHFITSITNTSPDIITVFDLEEGKNIFANKELYDVLGYSEEEVEAIRQMGQAGLKKVVYPEDLSKAASFLESYKTYQGNSAREIDYRAYTSKGNIVWVTSRYNVFKRNEQGLPVQIIGVTRDITARKEAEEHIRLSEARLMEAQARASLGDWEYDLNGKTKVHWSGEMYRIFGVDSDIEMSDQLFRKLVGEETHEILKARRAEAIIAKRDYELEYKLNFPDGSQKTIYHKGTPVTDSQGNVVKIQGISQDVTERVNIERELRESKLFVQAVTEAVPSVIFVHDIITKEYLYTNREMRTLIGFTQEEVQKLGSNLLNVVIHPDDLHILLDRDEKFKTANPDEIIEITYRVKDINGSWLWIRSISKIFKWNDKGEPWQILGVAENVNEKVIAEQELKRAYFALQETNEELVRTEELLTETNNELEERVEKRTIELSQKNKQLGRINAELDNFIYTASHDLKAPITNLEGLLQALNRTIKDTLPLREARIIGMMDDSINRLKKTIKDLTEVSKIQLEIEEESAEPVNVQELLKDIKKDIASLLAVTNPIIKTDFQVKEIFFARKNLRSIFYNLLTNAVKYRDELRRPEIFLRTYLENEDIVISVQDNGVGIAKEQHHKVFSLFRRLQTNVEGSGIGLYLVKKIVDNYGGRIEIESEVGKGTIFKIYVKNSTINA